MPFFRVSATLRAMLAWSALLNLAPAADVEYARDIRPLLSHKCGACHGALRQEAGLRLDAGSLIYAGGDSGEVIDLDQPAASLLLQRVAADDPADRMPPEGEGEPLEAAQIELLTRWIESGAAYPADEAIPADPAEHWAYRPVQRPDVPEVADPTWSQNPIDAFIAAQHAAHGITPVEVADRRTLLRRVYLDLIGLPPTREEQAAFLADDSPDAYERVVERLLESDLHAERWARHWMDVWRYSDWDGFGKELRGSQRHLWRWRDWIVESLAADKPYDRMVREMLAADELAPTDEDALRATGFLARQHYKLNRDLWLDNTVEHTFKAFLGMTLNCAKCHDHKYDPLPQTDYYAARAIFEPYQVRIDRIPGEADIEQNGLTRAYDADATAATYLYIRGNEKQPDKEQPIAASVPEVLGRALNVSARPLPWESWAPALRPHVIEESLAASRTGIEKARSAVDTRRSEHASAVALLASLNNPEPADEAAGTETAMLQEPFDELRDEVWETGDGEWSCSDGVLRQDRIAAAFSGIALRQPLPENFRASLLFRTLGGDTYHSVGLSFDDNGAGDSIGVYLSAHAPGPKLQVFIQQSGQTTYLNDAAKSVPAELNREYRLEAAVAGDLLNVWLDGRLLIAWKFTAPRQPGRLSLWTYDARAEFLEANLFALAEGVKLAESAGDQPVTTPEQAAAAVEQAALSVTLAEQQLTASEASLASLEARIEADRARIVEGTESDELSKLAAAAERVHALRAAEAAVTSAELALAKAQAAALPDDEKSQAAVKQAEEALTAARTKRDEAATAAEREDGEYTPFGERYPQTSSGRRVALAEWIASPENPLTARVAVNQLWMRHFGEPLVENVFDFGLRTPQPVQHALLDWLAAEFVESGWSMRRLHRLMVTSRVYRLASSSEMAHGVQPVGLEVDPENRLYWRANIQRLDAEVIRDCVLFVGGSLDLTRGGPDIDFAQGETVFRRSLYFRHAYEKQMRFLTVFDAASPNECYRRSESIVPQQALALANSPLAVEQSRRLAARLEEHAPAPDELGDRRGADAAFITAAFETILCRPPTDEELTACREYLESQPLNNSAAGETAAGLHTRTGLVHVLLNHNDFVTVR